MEERRIAYIWRPIAPLNATDARTILSEIEPLVSVWMQRKQSLQETEAAALKEFWDRLIRLWSIETGVLERVYDIDDGVTRVLVEQGLDATLVSRSDASMEPERLVTIVKDHQAAVEMCMDVIEGGRPLTVGFIKELHACIMANQRSTTAVNQHGKVVELEIAPGEFKKWPNTVTLADGSLHEYSPPEQAQTEIEKLVTWLQGYSAMDPCVVAAWLHHRFAQIHPFQDGNGRVARILANMLLIKQNLLPFVIRRTDREAYLEALRKADDGALEALIRFFESREKDTLLQALSFDPAEMKPKSKTTLMELAGDIGARHAKQQAVLKEQFRMLNSNAEVLSKTGLNHLLSEMNSIREIWQKMELTVSEVHGQWGGPAKDPLPDEDYRSDTEFYYQQQFTALAKTHEFWANHEESRFWFRVRFYRGPERIDFVCGLCHVGKPITGSMAAVAFGAISHEPVEEEARGSTQIDCMVRPFVFTYSEDIKSVKRTFQNWLTECLTMAIAEWGKRL